MLYMCYWKMKNTSVNPHGFVRADSLEDAEQIMRASLNKDCEIVSITQAREHWITPQSITINFPNITDYVLF